MIRSARLLALACAGFVLPAPVAANDEGVLPRFSTAPIGRELPAGWTPYSIARGGKSTEYDVVDVDGRRALRAIARASASALIHKVRIDTRRTPWLQWAWQIENVVRGADLAEKRGDDFAARLYVLFDPDPATLSFSARAKLAAARMIYGDEVPAEALCYVWDNRYPIGTIAPNAYTERVRTVVVESGEARARQWVRFSRDVAEDYRKAFGGMPPPVIGVVVATDTDNTGESAVTYVGDIAFSASPRSSP